MRHRLPIAAAIVGLILGSTFAAAYPVAAATGPAAGMVRPGGPMEPLTGSQSADGLPGQSTHTVVTSANWAGYSATGGNGQFTSVSADWVQPTGYCSRGDQYAAFWVGLDGYSSSTVEQTGSEVDCAGRTAVYYAWYEMYPGASEVFSNTVRAGDHFAGSVTYEGDNEFLLTLTDSTEGWTQSVTQTLAGADRSSAEIIAEAPSNGLTGAILPLTDFGTVSYTVATVNGANLCTTNPVEILMRDTAISSITGCQAFTVTYTGFGLPWPFGSQGS